MRRGFFECFVVWHNGPGRAIDLSCKGGGAMEGFCAAAALLPEALRRAAERLPEGEKRRCEELRLRSGRRATALVSGREAEFSPAPVSGEDIRAVLEAAARSSLHAAMAQLCRGYLSAPGGVRVGVCGAAVMGESGLEGLREFSSLALRVPRQVRGCADGIWGRVTEGGFRSLLIISPPGAGKTTLLRELIRRLSDSGIRVSVADERGEIAGAAPGAAQFDVGRHTDILTGVPKSRAAEMLLRAMNPQVIAMDEITDPRDAAALLDAVGCGVKLLATVHGTDAGDAAARPACRALFEAGAFSRCVTVENLGGARSYAVRGI